MYMWGSKLIVFVVNLEVRKIFIHEYYNICDWSHAHAKVHVHRYKLISHAQTRVHAQSGIATNITITKIILVTFPSVSWKFTPTKIITHYSVPVWEYHIYFIKCSSVYSFQLAGGGRHFSEGSIWAIWYEKVLRVITVDLHFYTTIYSLLSSTSPANNFYLNNSVINQVTSLDNSSSTKYKTLLLLKAQVPCVKNSFHPFNECFLNSSVNICKLKPVGNKNCNNPNFVKFHVAHI